MKSYEDIAERVFEKGDEILKRKHKRTALIKKTSLIVSEICAVILVCFGIWKTGDMNISPNNNNFPDNVVVHPEQATEFSAPVSASGHKNNAVNTSGTLPIYETDITASVFSTKSAPENTSPYTNVPNNVNTEQTQTVLQTDLRTKSNTTVIQTQITVCTTTQAYDEGSFYMKKLASFFTSAVVIASSAAPIIGNAEYKLDTSRYWPGEYAMFAKMDSGELDVDINGNGEFDILDGYTLEIYVEKRNDYVDTVESFLDQETIDRIEAIADYNGDGKINREDRTHLVRYFITKRKLKREYFEYTYYNPEYTYKYNQSLPEEWYVNILRDHMEALLAGYDIVAEMYENGTIDLDFNGNGQLDVGDVYDFFAYEDSFSGGNKEAIKNYISNEEWDRCDEAYKHYPTGIIGYPREKFKFYMTLYVAGHIELKPEYFTEEYYYENFENYHRSPFYALHCRMRDAAEYMGLKPDEDAWLKFNIDDFYEFFDAYCNDVENGQRSAPDVNMDGVVDYTDYFDSNTYLEDLLNSRTADDSLLPADVWNNIAENCDFNGNGTTKDIIDILTVQMYVVKYAEHPNDFDAAYKKYTESLGKTETTEIEGMSYENNLKILADLEKNNIVYGDVNDDGNITIADATLILQHIGNPDKHPFTDKQKKQADVCGNSDGITGTDVLTVQLAELGIIDQNDLPVQSIDAYIK